MTPRRLLLAATALALALPGPAAAAPAPCWQRLLNDYYDNGRIDHAYRASCYSEAIKRIPRPLRDYSDAYEVLTRNLQSALGRHSGKDRSDVSVPPPATPPSPPGGAAGGATPTGPSPAPFARVADTGSGGATAVPVPLLVLAGLGLLLTAGGAVAAILRRRRG